MISPPRSWTWAMPPAQLSVPTPSVGIVGMLKLFPPMPGTQSGIEIPFRPLIKLFRAPIRPLITPLKVPSMPLTMPLKI